jgi:hypothetical protein
MGPFMARTLVFLCWLFSEQYRQYPADFTVKKACVEVNLVLTTANRLGKSIRTGEKIKE